MSNLDLAALVFLCVAGGGLLGLIVDTATSDHFEREEAQIAEDVAYFRSVAAVTVLADSDMVNTRRNGAPMMDQQQLKMAYALAEYDSIVQALNALADGGNGHRSRAVVATIERDSIARIYASGYLDQHGIERDEIAMVVEAARQLLTEHLDDLNQLVDSWT